MHYTYTVTVNGVATDYTIDVPEADILAAANNAMVGYVNTDASKRTGAENAYINTAFPLYLAKATAPASIAQIGGAFNTLQATPRYLNPGDPPAADENGRVINIRADGSVYRNGIKLGLTMTKILLYGDGVYGKQATGTWWTLDGAAWHSLLASSLDTAIFL